MTRFSELLQELAQSERHVAEGQARIARQAELVRELDADGHDTTFSAKRLLVTGANSNQLKKRRPEIVMSPEELSILALVAGSVGYALWAAWLVLGF
jgi:hypothetical protein